MKWRIEQDYRKYGKVMPRAQKALADRVEADSADEALQRWAKKHRLNPFYFKAIKESLDRALAEAILGGPEDLDIGEIIMREAREVKLKPNEASRVIKKGDRVGYQVNVSGMFSDTAWNVSKMTPKLITIWSPSRSPRFQGRKYQYRWNGECYARQGDCLLHIKGS